MEKRSSRRLNVFFNAIVNATGKSYEGFIGNISEHGFYVRVRSVNSSTKFIAGTAIDLKFNPLSEDPLILHCYIKWSYEMKLDTQPGHSAYNLGIEIINPCAEFRYLYHNKSREKLNSIIQNE